MKSTLFIALSVISMVFADQKSDTWRVFLNKKLLLSATEENETKNIVQIKRAMLNKAGELSIKYNEAIPNKDWIRTFAIFDGDTSIFELIAKNEFRISNAKLKKLAATKTRIKLYTWSFPSNPALASTIRLRRVHLCTLELQ